MFETFLQYPFLQRAMLAAVLVGLICALMGVFVVFNKMAFFVDALAHSALTGIAIGILIGVAPFWTALVFGVLVAVGVVYIKSKGKIETDTALGLFMPFAMALGILLLQLKSGYTPDLMSFLFGSVLAVSWIDLIIILVIGILSLGWLYTYYKDLVFMAFDRESALVSGIKINQMDYWLMVLLSMVVIASLQVAGIILVGAMIVIPAASAKNIARNFREVVVYSGIIGLVGSVTGMILSYVFDLSSGAVIVMTMVGIYLVTFVLRRNQ
ncbi:metal ABC transporter permease [Patescibacteria group bacterium]|nr:metal ABC transporter permease [Patescibacteria group bacterium]